MDWTGLDWTGFQNIDWFVKRGLAKDRYVNFTLFCTYILKLQYWH